MSPLYKAPENGNKVGMPEDFKKALDSLIAITVHILTLSREKAFCTNGNQNMCF